MDNSVTDQSSRSAGIAAILVAARQAARPLPDYPGPLPRTLDEGYACQDAAMALWDEPVVGWKVGRIPDHWVERLHEDRLVGPIFAGSVQLVLDGQSRDFPAIAGGFAAVEAEFVFLLRADAPPDKIAYSHAEAAELVGELRIGIEMAGSPLPLINVLGPAVVVSDFGNNAGLLVGPPISQWHALAESDLECETFIDGHSVGRGGAGSIAGGLLEALAFALGRCARRGHPLKAGMHVTTGAATGIHDILAGQSARISFGRWGELHCRVVAARPAEPA